MKPGNDHVRIEIVKDDGVLNIVNDQYGIGKVVEMPIEGVATGWFKAGDTILFDYVKDYDLPLHGHVYYTKVEHVVTTL